MQIHIHMHDYQNGHDIKRVLSILNIHTQKLNQMAETFDTLKEKMDAQASALDQVSTNVTGIQTDVQFLKDKIAGTPAGVITQEQLDELGAAADAIGAKVDDIGRVTATLDSETDPNG